MTFARSWIAACSLLGALATGAQGAPRVDFEVSFDPGFPRNALPQWNELIAACGADGVRLGGNVARRLTIEKSDGAGGGSYRVFGILTPRNQLAVSGGTFALGDRAKLSKWIADLKSAGPPLRPGEKPKPFGLSAEQLDAAARDLARVVDFDTAGMAPAQLLTELGNRLRSPVTADENVAALLARAEKIPGELKGLACGTVAAAVLRRDGLSLAPRATSTGVVEYVVFRAAAGQDVWPVGWPSEKPVFEIVPELFTLRNVAIDGNKASEVLQIVADRVKLPMLFDEQMLVLKELDPSQVSVRIPEAKMGYEGVLDRALFQADLKHEVRLDDAGKPFLWITARRP